MTDPEIASICAEYGIRVVDGHNYPAIGETRAVVTLRRILNRYGEGHLRLILSTISETNNNKACLDESSLWSISDLVIVGKSIIDTQASAWLEFFDTCPLGELHFLAQDLSGYIPVRHALSGMIYERIVHRFGQRYEQPDLFYTKPAE